jgi:hypothetical protein
MKQMYAEHDNNENVRSKFLRSLFKPQKSEPGSGTAKRSKKACLAPAPNHARLTIPGKKVVLRDFWYLLSVYKTTK